MTDSRTSNSKFWAITVVAIVAAGGGLAALWPVALSAARSESATLTTEGRHAAGAEAVADFQLAARLDPQNHAAYIALARDQIASGQPDAAFANLDHAGKGSDVEQLRVRTLIELGRSSAAAAAAQDLTTPDRSQADLLLATLSYLNADRRADATALMPRLTSPEAAGSATRAASGEIGLASELYATGLQNSSSAILTAAPTSYERNLLLARILYARHTRPSLTTASDYLASATSLNPGGLEARQLLARVYRDLGNIPDATTQEALAAKLQNGRP
jgi:thioredoxin-like negative regulator of GroEL